MLQLLFIEAMRQTPWFHLQTAARTGMTLQHSRGNADWSLGVALSPAKSPTSEVALEFNAGL